MRSLPPSARAKGLANPVEIDVGNSAGEVRGYIYRGETMLVLHRTEQMLEQVSATADLVLTSDTTDPAYVDPTHRAIVPEFLAVRGVCTHLGCVPQIEREEGKRIVGEWWPGGFICPCHQSAFDYAGRVIRGPAPRNLPVPPHRFAGPARLIIGEEFEPT